jgi:hypothetical protein
VGDIAVPKIGLLRQLGDIRRDPARPRPDVRGAQLLLDFRKPRGSPHDQAL